MATPVADLVESPTPTPLGLMPQVLAADRWLTNGHLVPELFRLGYLHESWRILDPTYGESDDGVFWQQVRPPGLVAHSNDIDFRRLPYADHSFDAAIYDPCYQCVGGRDTSGIKAMLHRYGMLTAPRTPEEVQEVMNDGLTDLARVVRRPRTVPAEQVYERRAGRRAGPPLLAGGFIIQKCSDYVWSGSYWEGEHYTRMHAASLGLVVVDKFLFIGNPGPQPKRSECLWCEAKIFRRADGVWSDWKRSGDQELRVICPEGAANEHEPNWEMAVQDHAARNLSTVFVFQHGPEPDAQGGLFP